MGPAEWGLVVSTAIVMVIAAALILFVMWLIDMEPILRDWIFSSNDNLLLRTAAVVIWLPLAIFVGALLLIGCVWAFNTINDILDRD